VPPARPVHEDALADSIALVESYSADDTEAMAAIIVNCPLAEVVITLAKIVAEEHAECGCIASGDFRSWAIEVANRS